MHLWGSPRWPPRPSEERGRLPSWTAAGCHMAWMGMRGIATPHPPCLSPYPTSYFQSKLPSLNHHSPNPCNLLISLSKFYTQIHHSAFSIVHQTGKQIITLLAPTAHSTIASQSQNTLRISFSRDGHTFTPMAAGIVMYYILQLITCL